MISLGTYLSQKYTNKKIISESDTEIYAFLFDYISYSAFFSYLSISNIVNVNSTLLQIIIYISTWGLIFLISPVESENKHFTYENRKNLRKRLFISFIIITIIRKFTYLFYYI